MLPLPEGETIDPLIFDCSKLTIKTSRVRAGTSVSLLERLVRQLITAHTAGNLSGTGKSSFQTSINTSGFSRALDSMGRSKKEKHQPNPLLGYRIKRIVASAPDTKVLRIPKALFMRFLERSVYPQWTDKALLPNFPNEIRVDQYTRRQKNFFLRDWKFKMFEKN